MVMCILLVSLVFAFPIEAPTSNEYSVQTESNQIMKTELYILKIELNRIEINEKLNQTKLFYFNSVQFKQINFIFY